MSPSLAAVCTGPIGRELAADGTKFAIEDVDLFWVGEARRRDFARQRHALIAAHPELRERELIKLASLATAIAAALRRRGVVIALAAATIRAYTQGRW
jgi:hypothetical protein